MGRTITPKQEEVLNSMCYGARSVLLGTLLKELIEKGPGGGGSGEENVIEQITIAGVPLIVKDKTVEIPAATATTLGLVKGGNKSGDVIVDSEGTILIKTLPLSSIEQGKNDILVLDGGTAII